jgi:hypothetical protein
MYPCGTGPVTSIEYLDVGAESPASSNPPAAASISSKRHRKDAR